MYANGYHERLTLTQYRVGLAIKQRLRESDGTRCILTMRYDGATIVLTRLHLCDDMGEDRFILSSQVRFSWGARNTGNLGIWMMRSITWKRVITLLMEYHGDVRLAG